jgi:hypothetical protein
MGDFKTDCDKCNMLAVDAAGMPTFSPADCADQVCDDTACNAAYMAAEMCLGFVDPTNMMANTWLQGILPFGQFCDADSNEAACSETGVQLSLGALFQACGCTQETCLAKAQSCGFTGQCAMLANNLIAQCANNVPDSFKTVFDSATTAMLQCLQPTCSDTTYQLVGPFAPVPAVDCCTKAGKGAHGPDKSCCLKNPKQSDEQQPDAFTNPMDKDAPCCYDDTKGTCPLKSGASSVAAGLMTVLATLVALLL